MLGPVPAGVGSLDPEQEGAVPVAREVMRHQRGISVAEMQPAGRTWRETGDGLHKALTGSRPLWCHEAVTQAGDSVADQERTAKSPVSRVLGATGFVGR